MTLRGAAVAIPQLDGDMPGENQKEIVGIVVLMPNEFTFDFHHHQVMAVEAADDARLPIFIERRKFLREIDWVHRINSGFVAASHGA